MNDKLLRLIGKYSHQSSDLVVMIGGLSGSDLDKCLARGKWSIREQVSHLADCEMNYVQRMKKVIAEEKPLLPAFESDKWAKTLFYGESSAEDSISLFFTLRSTMTRILRKLSNRDFERIGIHTEEGKVTLLSILEMAVEHVDHHSRSIMEIKKKSKMK